MSGRLLNLAVFAPALVSMELSAVAAPLPVQTGDRVRVDGGRGTVEILENEHSLEN